MSQIHIKRQQRRGPDGETLTVFAVPAMAITTQQGRKLIPNPAGTEACIFKTLEEAEAAIRHAGFDYVFEGRTSYTFAQQQGSASTVAGLVLEDAVPILIQRLKDREPTVVANAAFALGELRAMKAVNPLVEVVGHEDPAVRKNVAEALSKLGPIALEPLKKAYEQVQNQTGQDANLIRLNVTATYLEMARTKQWAMLGFVLPQVLHALQDDNWLVRAQAALIMGHAAPLKESASGT
ncbi:MAG: HEAT repeat domain-containing protein [Candidatus Melainabacteria bacterium]|nr:HEAT repeat domain-containing protein [Candidatus Melainabacteria bacterium]